MFCSTSTPESSVVQPLINYVNMKAVHTDNNTMLDETSDRVCNEYNITTHVYKHVDTHNSNMLVDL